MYCTNCGATMGPGAGFCTSCGQPVAATPAPAPQPAAPMQPAPMPMQPAQYPGAPVSPPASGAAKLGVLVVVILLVLLLVGGGVAWLLLAGPQQTGACVEEWQYQSPTRKEGWTRSECEAFCASGVNPNHLACYFEPY